MNLALEVIEGENPFLSALRYLDGGKAWIKGITTGFSNGVFTYCAIGSLRRVSREWYPGGVVLSRLALASWVYERGILNAVVREQYPDRVKTKGQLCAVATFNDHPDTTWEDIEKVFEKAALRWEEDNG